MGVLEFWGFRNDSRVVGNRGPQPRESHDRKPNERERRTGVTLHFFPFFLWTATLCWCNMALLHIPTTNQETRDDARGEKTAPLAAVDLHSSASGSAGGACPRGRQERRGRRGEGREEPACRPRAGAAGRLFRPHLPPVRVVDQPVVQAGSRG